jgi:carbohydrate-binding DOMON domain-containing protein
MKKAGYFVMVLIILSMLILTGCASAGSPARDGTIIELKDPSGDDKGPGNYTYPTDPIYVPGSFDLVGTTIEDKGEMIEFNVRFNAPLSFNWGDKWDVQLVQIYLDFDNVEGSGHTETIPGVQVQVHPECAWEKVVFIGPHTESKINSEIDLKAEHLKDDIVLPSSIRPIGRSLRASVRKADLGVSEDADITEWGYGILMLSATGFPADWSVLARRVNEYEGQHRFGGGSDGSGNPNVIDMIVGEGAGREEEKHLQYEMLSDYESGMDPEDTSDNRLAVIRLVYPGKN